MPVQGVHNLPFKFFCVSLLNRCPVSFGWTPAVVPSIRPPCPGVEVLSGSGKDPESLLENKEPHSICCSLLWSVIISEHEILPLQPLVKDIFEFREVLVHGRLVKNKLSWISDILLLTASGNLYVSRRDVHKGWLCNELIHKHC